MELQSIHEFDKLLNHYDMIDIGAEIGVAEGRTSLEFLGMGVGYLYLIDVWQHIPNISGDANEPQLWHDNNLAIAKEKLKNYFNRVKFLKGRSTEMATHIPDNSLGFIYLDASHRFADVLNDLSAYVPKLRQGGICAGHDFLNESYGVKEAVEVFCKDKYEVHLISEQSKENAGFWFQKI